MDEDLQLTQNIFGPELLTYSLIVHAIILSQFHLNQRAIINGVEGFVQDGHQDWGIGG